MLHSTRAVLKPRIKLVETRFRYLFKDDYSTMISKLCKDEVRNELIARTVFNDFKQYKENILIVSDRVTHCKAIEKELEKLGMKTRLLSGKVSSETVTKIEPRGDVHCTIGQVNKMNKQELINFAREYKVTTQGTMVELRSRIKKILFVEIVTDGRKEIVEEVKAGKVNVLIATLSLVGEGFDAPNLCSLFLTTPVKFSGRLIQVVGRVLRPEKGKIPRVYDFRDVSVNILMNSARQRDKIYRAEWG
jgi:superfamily II DNA or RNA helicase